MATNDRTKTEDDYGCYPYEEMKSAHDKIRSGDYPEKPPMTSTDKLMKPQSEELEG